MQRPIIEIDANKCDGCGQCVLDCAEGALAIVDGKARLVSESYCDGLGACLHCPQGALSIVTREADAFDEEAATAAKHQEKENVAGFKNICPGSSLNEMAGIGGLGRRAPLSSWPIQLRLLPSSAPFLRRAKILLAAHCTGFACHNLHENWLSGRTLIIACPKLEPKAELFSKLVDILQESQPESMDILRMSVPCCGGLARLVDDAMAQTQRVVPIQVHTVAIP